MRLVQLAIKNYRSIRDQTDKQSVELGGYDCFVGPNNAGKSNILRAISYLLNGESDSDDLFFGRNRANSIVVSGTFEVKNNDLNRLKVSGNLDKITPYLDDQLLRVCRRSESERNDLELVALMPADERLERQAFDTFHAEAWTNKGNKKDFQDRMEGQFPEVIEFLAEGKESNKGEWKTAYHKLVAERPANVTFSWQPVPVPTGISADVRNLLPRIIRVPAVKEVTDSTKTTKAAELGSLLRELSSTVEQELDEAINDAMASVYARLNVVRDPATGAVIDDRHDGVRAIEQRISSYLAETFQDHAASLEFPNPESKAIFEGARVWIEEEGFGRFPVTEVGEGIKRILIYSLFRTLADLRRGDLAFETIEPAPSNRPDAETHQPLLILYEEAELFLHPGLQRILGDALARLSKNGDQVVFTTHSPFMIQDQGLTTINVVRKHEDGGTQVVEFNSILQKRSARDQQRLLRLQSISNYIFSDTVLLVEGLSDRIVISKLAPVLRDEWDFERAGIPILSVGGKGDLKLFADMLSELDIRPVIMTDIDAVRDVIPNLCPGQDAIRCRDELVQRAQEIADEMSGSINSGDISSVVKSKDWQEVLDLLEELQACLEDGDPATTEQRAALARLLEKRRENAVIRALRSDDSEIKENLVALCTCALTEDVLLLQGSIEQYYPYHGGNKVDAALGFNAAAMTTAEILESFGRIKNSTATDVEIFLDRIFAPNRSDGIGMSASSSSSSDRS